VPTAKELFQAGKLNEAIEAVSAELRSHPTDQQRRTFLFELLCFAGNWDRADKQLDLLAGEDPDQRMGALFYRAAIAAERTRQEKFGSVESAEEESSETNHEGIALSGKLNGTRFSTFEDADSRIGRRLEIIAAENYIWMALDQVRVLEMDAPKRLRDLLWAPARLETSGGADGADLGEVLLPVLCPFSSNHTDDAVRLGRMTVWEDEIPFGQKMFFVDGEEFPLLEIRRLEIDPRPGEEGAPTEG
jgi:type VI secretion system protein ImpE